MTDISSFIIGMMMYSLGGALHFSMAVSYFKAGKYFFAGAFGMVTISMILCMAHFIFSTCT